MMITAEVLEQRRQAAFQTLTYELKGARDRIAGLQIQLRAVVLLNPRQSPYVWLIWSDELGHWDLTIQVSESENSAKAIQRLEEASEKHQLLACNSLDDVIQQLKEAVAAATREIEEATAKAREFRPAV